MMARKMTSGLVFILVLLLTTVPAWSMMSDLIIPAGSGKTLATDPITVADDTFEARIILARGGNGGDHGGGGQGGHGNGAGDGDCDGDGHGPGPDANDSGYGSAAEGPGRGHGGSENW